MVSYLVPDSCWHDGEPILGVHVDLCLLELLLKGTPDTSLIRTLDQVNMYSIVHLLKRDRSVVHIGWVPL